MPKVSRWKLSDEIEKELLNQFWSAITLLENKTEVINFLKALLMPSESIMLAKRIGLVKLLRDGVRLADIRKKLHVTKVTSYRWLERQELYYEEFKIIIDRLSELEREKARREGERQKHPIDRKRHSLAAGALAAAGVAFHSKMKKIYKKKSAKL